MTLAHAQIEAPIEPGSVLPDGSASIALSNASAQIERLRAACDWMITHPDWEGSIALSIARLEFKGQRQGVSFRQAALSLSLEERCAVLRHALKEGLSKPRIGEARHLAALWGYREPSDTAGRSRPSESRWSELSRQILLLIAARYSDYKAAQLVMYQRYAPIADREARVLCRSFSHRDDAIQEGRLALLQAIDRIDSQREFERYAKHWIRRRIRNFLLQQSVPVKAPLNLVSETWRQKGFDRVAPPLLDLSPEGTVRLDDPQSDSSPLADPETLLPCHRAMLSEESGLLARALKQLTSAQRQAIALRYGLEDGTRPRSLAAAASVFGISRQQVFQREQRALRSLERLLADLRPDRSASSR